MYKLLIRSNILVMLCVISVVQAGDAPGELTLDSAVNAANLALIVDGKGPADKAVISRLKITGDLSDGIQQIVFGADRAHWRSKFQSLTLEECSPAFAVKILVQFQSIRQVRFLRMKVSSGVYSALGGLGALEELSFAGGEIDAPVSGLQSSGKLRQFGLSGVTVSPETKFNLPDSAVIITVANIKVTAAVIDAIMGGRSALHSLTIAECEIDESAAMVIGELRCRYLFLLKSRFTGNDCWKNFKDLDFDVLNLTGMGIHDDMLAQLKIRKINYLIVADNPLTDNSVGTLLRIPGLVNLAVGGTKIGNIGAGELLRSGKLFGLGLDRLNVDDALFKSVEGMKISELGIANTGITDFGLPNVLGVSGLKSLNIAGTKVTPNELRRQSSLHPGIQINY